MIATGPRIFARVAGRLLEQSVHSGMLKSHRVPSRALHAPPFPSSIVCSLVIARRCSFSHTSFDMYISTCSSARVQLIGSISDGTSERIKISRCYA